jgi:hypothetical protein
MTTRVARLLAAAGLAIAGVGTPLMTLWALAAQRGITVPAALVCWATLAVYMFLAPNLWPAISPTRARWTLLRAEATAVIALVIGWMLWYAISVDNSLCGHTNAEFAVGLAVYVVVGAILLQKPRLAVVGWPVAVALGWAVAIGLSFVLPGARGFCET